MNQSKDPFLSWMFRFMSLWLFAALVVWGIIIAVAVHFISKYW